MKAGIRFEKEKYIQVDLDNEANIKLTADIDGTTTEYDVTGGGGGAAGSSTLDLRTFPRVMTANNEYQIVYTVSDGATIEFNSNASSTKISVNESGLMHCIGSTTGACVITITTKNTNGDSINETKMKVTVE